MLQRSVLRLNLKQDEAELKLVRHNRMMDAFGSYHGEVD